MSDAVVAGARRRKINWVPYALLAPGILWLVVFFVAPRHDPSVHDPSAPEELSKDEKPSLIRAVIAEIRRVHKRKMVELCIAAGLSNLFLLAMPMFSMSVYDRVIPHLAMETLWALAIGVGVPSPGAAAYGPCAVPGATTNHTPPTPSPFTSPAAVSAA